MAESAIQWGAARNRCQVGVSFDVAAPVAGAASTTVTIRAYWRADVNMWDNVNGAGWSGLASGSAGSTSLGQGQQLLRTITATVALGLTATTGAFTYTQTNIEYSGSVTVTGTVSIPARKLSAPAPPSGVSVTKTAEQRFLIGWIRNAPDSASAPYQSIIVQRRADEDTTFYTVATLGATAVSWTDTGVSPASKYEWRVLARNTGGTSISPQSAVVYTTPRPPTAVAAVKSGTTINLTWAHGSPYRDAYVIEERQDGVGAWAALATVTGSSATSYAHVGALNTVTHQYRVRTRITSQGVQLLSDPSAASNIVQLLAAPAAPSNLSPDGVGADTDAPIVLSWRHNPVDTTAQSAYELSRRLSADGGATWGAWTTVTGTTASTLTLTGLSPGQLMQWRVRTRGQHADWSPLSATAQVNLTTRPSVTLLSPADGGVVASSTMIVTWSIYDAESDTQTAAEVTLWDAAGSSEIRRKTIVGSAASTVFTELPDGAAYQVRVVATAGGLSSPAVTANVTVAYPPPPAPEVVITYQPDTGSALIEISNPTPTGVQPHAVENRVYLGDRLIGVVPLSSSIIDPVPDLRGASTYTVHAVSSLPSKATTEAVLTLPPYPAVGWHVNAGPDFTTHASLPAGAPTVALTIGLDVAAERFDGDRKPSATFGPGEPWEAQIGGLLRFADPDSSEWDWEQIRLARTSACLRSRDTFRFGVLTALTLSKATPYHGSLSFTFVETAIDPSELDW